MNPPRVLMYLGAGIVLTIITAASILAWPSNALAKEPCNPTVQQIDRMLPLISRQMKGNRNPQILVPRAKWFLCNNQFVWKRQSTTVWAQPSPLPQVVYYVPGNGEAPSSLIVAQGFSRGTFPRVAVDVFVSAGLDGSWQHLEQIVVSPETQLTKRAKQPLLLNGGVYRFDVRADWNLDWFPTQVVLTVQ